jgi:hypothetical protein
LWLARKEITLASNVTQGHVPTIIWEGTILPLYTPITRISSLKDDGPLFAVVDPPPAAEGGEERTWEVPIYREGWRSNTQLCVGRSPLAHRSPSSLNLVNKVLGLALVYRRRKNHSFLICLQTPLRPLFGKTNDDGERQASIRFCRHSGIRKCLSLRYKEGLITSPKVRT